LPEANILIKGKYNKPLNVTNPLSHFRIDRSENYIDIFILFNENQRQS